MNRRRTLSALCLSSVLALGISAPTWAAEEGVSAPTSTETSSAASTPQGTDATTSDESTNATPEPSATASTPSAESNTAEASPAAPSASARATPSATSSTQPRAKAAAPIQVTPPTPAITDRCGAFDDMVTVPRTPGLIWTLEITADGETFSQRVQPGKEGPVFPASMGSSTLIARAASGYVITPGATTRFGLTATDVPCAKGKPVTARVSCQAITFTNPAGNRPVFVTYKKTRTDGDGFELRPGASRTVKVKISPSGWYALDLSAWEIDPNELPESGGPDPGDFEDLDLEDLDLPDIDLTPADVEEALRAIFGDALLGVDLDVKVPQSCGSGAGSVVINSGIPASDDGLGALLGWSLLGGAGTAGATAAVSARRRR